VWYDGHCEARKLTSLAEREVLGDEHGQMWGEQGIVPELREVYRERVVKIVRISGATIRRS